MVPNVPVLAPHGLKIMQIVRYSFLLHFTALTSILAPYGLKIMQIVRNAFLLHFAALTSILDFYLV